MRLSWMKRLAALSFVLFAFTMPLGGCKLTCEADDTNDVEDAVDEVGDEVEDVVREIKND